MTEAVGAPEVGRGVGGERRERVLSLDPVAAQEMAAAWTEHYRPVLTRVNHQEPDVGVAT